LKSQKKIVFTALYPLWHYHFISELNLIQKYLLEGAEVFILECDEALRACECNREHEIHNCIRCIKIREDGLSALDGAGPIKIKLGKLSSADKKAQLLLKNIANLEDLKKLKYKSFDIGYAVFSSLVDHTLNTAPCVVENQKKILKLLADGINTFDAFNNLLDDIRPDEVFVFNGRFSVARAIVRSCVQKNVKYYTHERLGNLKKILIFERGFTHDPRAYSIMVESLWEKCGHQDWLLKEGRDFFEERPNGKLTGWQSFIKTQKRNRLPLGFDENCRNIAIFGSSQSEMLAIEGLIDGVNFPNQLDVYTKFLQLSSNICPGFKFYLRLHPNSTNEKIKWWQDPNLVKIPNLVIIEPESDISSYTLLQACEKVIGLASTICLEATYWGKPSIMLGPSYYSGINAVYEPESLEEACKLIKISELPPKPQFNAIKFGAFWRCYGEDLPYSNPHNYYTLDFKGKILGKEMHIHKWITDYTNKNQVYGFKKWLIWKLMLSRFMPMLNSFLYSLQRIQSDILWWRANWKSRLKI
jgi:hypothetical protein